MTILIGMLCSNGIVIGADSAYTIGTALEKKGNKIDIINEKIIVGIAGDVSLWQRFAEITKNYKDVLITADGITTTNQPIILSPIRVGEILSEKALENFKKQILYNSIQIVAFLLVHLQIMSYVFIVLQMEYVVLFLKILKLEELKKMGGTNVQEVDII